MLINYDIRHDPSELHIMDPDEILAMNEDMNLDMGSSNRPSLKTLTQVTTPVAPDTNLAQVYIRNKKFNVAKEFMNWVSTPTYEPIVYKHPRKSKFNGKNFVLESMKEYKY